jgi:hypothetical protein
MNLLTATVAERPDLAPLLGDFNPWPRFMHQDPVGSLYYADAVGLYPEFVQVAIDQDHPGQLVAKSYSVPFTWNADPAVSLPGEGWDGAIIYATLDRLAGRRGNLISALEISIRPDLRGSGLSRIMLGAMRQNAPNQKHLQPAMSIEEYAALRRADGLPADAWLRTHVRAGGTIVGVAPRAMMIAGSVADWREWTGLPFDATGPVTVPEALVPVHCDLAQDTAVYCEPCIWIHHRIT